MDPVDGNVLPLDGDQVVVHRGSLFGGFGLHEGKRTSV